MGIMDMFRNTAVPAAGTPQPTAVATPGNPHLPTPNAAAPAPDASASNNNGMPAPAGGGNPPSPMDAHASLWKNDTTNNSAPAPLFDLDPAKLQEAIKDADFTKQIPPELFAKALGGDAAALSAIVNGTAQSAFSHQTMATTKLIEQALDKRDAVMRSQMTEAVRRNRISENLQDHPIYQHEATRPILNALEQQLAQKHPTATATQIAEQARNYLKEFADIATGANKPTNEVKTGEPDWGNF